MPLHKVTTGILINDLSDHLPIFVSIKSAHVEKVDTKAQFKHDFSNFNAEEFMDKIKENLLGLPYVRFFPDMSGILVAKYASGRNVTQCFIVRDFGIMHFMKSNHNAFTVRIM